MITQTERNTSKRHQKDLNISSKVPNLKRQTLYKTFNKTQNKPPKLKTLVLNTQFLKRYLLTPSLLLTLIVFLADKDRERFRLSKLKREYGCNYSIANLAKQLGLSTRTVSRCLTFLQQDKMLTVYRRKSGNVRLIKPNEVAIKTLLAKYTGYHIASYTSITKHYERPDARNRDLLPVSDCFVKKFGNRRSAILYSAIENKCKNSYAEPLNEMFKPEVIISIKDIMIKIGVKDIRTLNRHCNILEANELIKITHKSKTSYTLNFCCTYGSIIHEEALEELKGAEDAEDIISKYHSNFSPHT